MTERPYRYTYVSRTDGERRIGVAVAEDRDRAERKAKRACDATGDTYVAMGVHLADEVRL